MANRIGGSAVEENQNGEKRANDAATRGLGWPRTDDHHGARWTGRGDTRMTLKRKHWFFELVDGASLIVVMESDGKRQYSLPLWLYQHLGLRNGSRQAVPGKGAAK